MRRCKPIRAGRVGHHGSRRGAALRGKGHARRFSERPNAVWLALIFIAVMAAACGREPLRAEPELLDRATPELTERLRRDPFEYFRFVNRVWIARVCDKFGKDRPVVRLHGDAHVEQFAFTNDAWGLDDFDDSARGPVAVDIVRFLGSIDLAARQRSWERARDHLFDRFFAGFRRGFTDPRFLPPPPEIVRRLRSQARVTRAAFLAREENKMQPLPEAAMKAVLAAMHAFARVVVSERPDLAPEYFRVARAGWLQSGVGSAASPKVLVRVRGPSDDPEDDEILELKKIGDLSGLNCLETPTIRPTLRIIDGSKQIGRVKYGILAAGPELAIPEVTARGQRLQDWWIRNLDPSYRQIGLSDLGSVDDLAAMAYDAGVQFGAARYQGRTIPKDDSERKQVFAAAARREKRYRREASKLVDDLLRGWRELRAG